MYEPQRIDQTEFGENGNCQSACLAMMLGLSIEEVPNFTKAGETDLQRYRAMHSWLAKRGYQILTFNPWINELWPPRGFFIAGGMSSRGYMHAVIIKDGTLWHDPHPDRDGIEEIEQIDLLLPLYPWRRI